MSTVHLHLLLNHVPVIGTLIAVGLLGYAAVRRDQGLTRVCLGMLVALALVAVAVFFTGEPAEEAVEGLAGVSESTIERHEEAALLATIALGALGVLSAGALLRFRRRALPPWTAAVFVVLGLIPTLAMGWTANLGGQIRHSEIRANVEVAPQPLAGGAQESGAQAER